MSDLKPLEPIDFKRCQAEKPSGHSFMTLGGRPGDMIRCENKPTVVAVESKPGDDGRTGSMSLCDDCRAVFIKQMPAGFATFTAIEGYRVATAKMLLTTALIETVRAECNKFDFPDEDRPELWEALQALDAVTAK